MSDNGFDAMLNHTKMIAMKYLMMSWLAFGMMACGLAETPATSDDKVKAASEQQQRNTYEDVDADQMIMLLESSPGLVLDVRTEGEMRDGVIGDPAKCDYHRAEFTDCLGSLDPETTVYVYCRSGGRSSDAAKMLADRGFKKVYNLKGGITGWKAKGYPIQ